MLWYRRLSARQVHGLAIAALFAGSAMGALVVVGQAQEKKVEVARSLTGGDPSHAEVIVRRYGCGGCHAVEGMAGADGQVAPPLADMRQRVFIGGVARNTPDNLVNWIVDPQRLSPPSAMPRTGIGEQEARDVAAYLYSR